MKMHTYVNFAGNCAEAFRYYEQHLGGRVEMAMKFREAPAPGPLGPEWADKVLHAQMTIGDALLMGADIPGAQPTRSAYLSLDLDSDAEAERIYAALSVGGETLMPMQETFFATRFAQVRDRFGIAWMIIHQRPAPAGP